MLLIRSLLFNICFFAWTIFLCIVGVPLLFVERQGVRRAGVAWARGTIWLLRMIIGAEFEVRGPYLGGARLVAAKHQSAFDTMVFYILAADPVYVMKDELTRIPVFSRLARHQRMIIVDRSGGAGALKQLLREAHALAAENRQIVSLPQGTRTAPGETVADAPYQAGIAALYQLLKLPTTPIALNSGLVWGRRSFIKRPGKIIIELLPEIPAGLSRVEFMRRLEEAIEPATRRLEAETAQPGKT